MCHNRSLLPGNREPRHGLHQNVEALCGRTVKLYQDNQAVCAALCKMSSKCPALMVEIKDLVPWLHENKIRLDVVYIRLDLQVCTDHLRLQPEYSGSRIRHSASLSSQRSLQRLAPRLVSTRYCGENLYI